MSASGPKTSPRGVVPRVRPGTYTIARGVVSQERPGTYTIGTVQQRLPTCPRANPGGPTPSARTRAHQPSTAHRPRHATPTKATLRRPGAADNAHPTAVHRVPPAPTPVRGFPYRCPSLATALAPAVTAAVAAPRAGPDTRTRRACRPRYLEGPPPGARSAPRGHRPRVAAPMFPHLGRPCADQHALR